MSIISCDKNIPVEEQIEKACGNPYHVHAVDLGLSVHWACCNVGAESPEEYGDYFAWGETVPKYSYNSENHFAYNLYSEELESRGIIDGHGNLTAAYDVATVNWGGNWRMPTSDEMEELTDKCTWEWTSMNGINGYKVTGPNGNSIFLPAAGRRVNAFLENAGDNGHYRTATWRELYFFSDGFYYGFAEHLGNTVRPVIEINY